MNDIRRTILWVIFGFSMVLLWDKWQLHNGNKATFFPTTPAVTAPAAAQQARLHAPGPPACQRPPRPALLRPRRAQQRCPVQPAQRLPPPSVSASRSRLTCTA
jgi:YidC/Oxa1 family membrane protein insertase